MKVNAYLGFPGTCQQAFEFYAQVLGGRIETIMTHESMKDMMPVSAGWEDKVLHARLAVGGTIIMGSDAPEGMYTKPAGFHISLSIDDVAEAERVFGALAEGGAVQMPLQKTFWAAAFGMLVDRYGVPWMVNCEQAG